MDTLGKSWPRRPGPKLLKRGGEDHANERVLQVAAVLLPLDHPEVRVALIGDVGYPQGIDTFRSRRTPEIPPCIHRWGYGGGE